MQTIWVEIPARDLERAKRFYEDVFGHEPTDIIEDGPRRITVLPGTPSVSLNEVEGFVPSVEGSLPYFHLDGTMTNALRRVSAAGGAVLEAGASRGDLGDFALISDIEGNALTIHTTGL